MARTFTTTLGAKTLYFGWAGVLAVAGFSGCAFAPQAVVISPKVDVPVSRVGADRALGLTIVDERPRQTLGTRGVRGVGAELTVQGDLRTIVETALLEGLAKQSFKAKAGQGADGRDLRVEIRHLDYMLIQGFRAGTLRVDIGLKANCVRGDQRRYEQLHRGEFVESVQVVQGPEANDAYISQAVSGAVNSLLKDEKLIACLSG